MFPTVHMTLLILTLKNSALPANGILPGLYTGSHLCQVFTESYILELGFNVLHILWQYINHTIHVTLEGFAI